MYLLAGVLPIAILVVVILHLLIFRRKKPNWINWLALVAVSGGSVALLGVGALHAGLMGLLTFIIGFFWLLVLKKTKKEQT